MSIIKQNSLQEKHQVSPKKTFDFVYNNSKLQQYTTEAVFFTRKRSLTFPVVVSSLLNLFKESVEYSISTILPTFDLKPVTGSAFSLARYKIDLSFFKDLNKILVDFNQKAPGKLWKGFQLIGGDGSTVSLPASRQIKEYFGVFSSSEKGVKSCLAQVFMLYDVLADIVIDGRISKMADGEKTLLKHCLTDLPESKAIFILDRGFGYFGVCKQLLNQQRDFCIRMSTSNSAFGKSAMGNPSNDFITYWEPSPAEKETCAKQGQDIQPIMVRVSKVKLKSGETELLISSLYDMKTFSLADLKELYLLRWGIEEGYKKLKPKMKLEHFGSRKPEGILQEFQIHLFVMNLVSIIGNAAQQEVDKKCVNRVLQYKYNWQNAFRFVRNKIVDLLRYLHPEHLIEQLIDLIAASVIPIKPDRTFPRLRIKKRKPRLYQTYK